MVKMSRSKVGLKMFKDHLFKIISLDNILSNFTHPNAIKFKMIMCKDGLKML